jgi:ribonuclease HII/Holliday junction resolvase-like predicted endonuclease
MNTDKLTAGVDEAGRGPLAGPVAAAAVILPEEHSIEGLRDSKKLTEKRREALYEEIHTEAVSIGVGIIHEDEIDRTNILAATHKAMRIAIGQLYPQPELALIDGYALPDQIVPNRGIIGGDDEVPSISAASIVAKVTRDRIMRNYALAYPEYGFDRNKGYGTREHINALQNHMACPIHRKSFNPVQNHLPTLTHLKDHRLVGKWGEKLAARYFVHNSYHIKEMNYSAPLYGEIDLIIRNGNEIIFVEVKTATQTKLGQPEDQIDDSKMEKLENAFEIYAAAQEEEWDYRFDIVSIILGKKGPMIKHFEDCLS